MNIDKNLGETLLHAVTNAIRYAHITDSPYDIRKLFSLHCTLVKKVYRSKEMQKQNWLPKSILEGTDLGLFSAVAEVNLGKAKIVKKFIKDIEKQR